MKVVLVWVGKTVEPWLLEGIEEYAQRLKHYLPFEIKEITGLRNAKNLSFDQIKVKEGESILAIFQPNDQVVLLDEGGKQFTSRQFAESIEKDRLSALKRLVFVIGGAYGFSPDVYNASKRSMSLSKLTYSHQMVRVVFLEQLYRAMTILRGEPYHHD